MHLRENLTLVEARIASACVRAGRRREEITLVAVTKVFPAAAILEAHEAGLRDFGENYEQEFEGKFDAVRHLAGRTKCVARRNPTFVLWLSGALLLRLDARRLID